LTAAIQSARRRSRTAGDVIAEIEAILGSILTGHW
jgi:hypothetical protein